MKADPRLSSLSLDLSEVKPGSCVTIGRDENCDIVLSDPDISSEHLKIMVREEGVFVRDMQSRQGSMVNHKTFSGLHRLNRNDVISLPKHDFIIRLPENPKFRSCRLTLDRVTVRTENHSGNKLILDDISFTVQPGEFVGIVGPSGCGKSTLIKALTGSLKISNGKIMLNGNRVQSEQLRRRTGYLPQSVIIHEKLTPAENLHHATRLFAPESADEETAILVATGIEEKSDQLSETLSGGQQKRVGLAQELLFSPDLLCMDEVTSGLDPLSERDMMLLFRSLSDQGKTLLCITHYPERLVLCDKLAVLMQGRLVFFGTPAETLKHFAIDSLENLYHRLNAHGVEYWLEHFQPESNDQETPADNALPLPAPLGMLHQFPFFLSRYFRIMTRSRADLIFNLLQGLFIGILIGLCFGTRPDKLTPPEQTARDTSLIFSLVLAAIWIGTTATVREIVKERIMLHHEGRRKFSAAACLSAKLTTVLLPVGICTLLLSAIVMIWTGIHVNEGRLGLLLLLTAAISAILGLTISAWSSTQEKALSILPVIVIGLVMFSGGIQELKGISADFARHGCYAYWSYEAARDTLKIESSVNQTTAQNPDKNENYVFYLLLHGMLFFGAATIGLRRITR